MKLKERLAYNQASVTEFELTKLSSQTMGSILYDAKNEAFLSGFDAALKMVADNMESVSEYTSQGRNAERAMYLSMGEEEEEV